MIVFFDPKSGRGGGQVVLERLLTDARDIDRIGLVMPARGRAAIALPDGVTASDELSGALASAPPDDPLVLVSNANAAFPTVAGAARRLRRAGRPVTSLGIVHNYPSTAAKRLATTVSLARLDHAVVVEPGLLTLRRDAVVPPWLGVPADHWFEVLTRVQRSGVVKTYGRPDPTKGLHLLPKVFSRLEATGLQCRVALGTALDGHDRYAERLRAALAPWLEDGGRNHTWIAPGDVFLVPSVAGEAACLSAQEAMARGSWVVASRIGLMPYLSPAGRGATTFATGDPSAAVAEVLRVSALPPDAFDAGCRAGQQSVRDRAGLWYDETLALLADLRRHLGATDGRPK